MIAEVATQRLSINRSSLYRPSAIAALMTTSVLSYGGYVNSRLKYHVNEFHDNEVLKLSATSDSNRELLFFFSDTNYAADDFPDLRKLASSDVTVGLFRVDSGIGGLHKTTEILNKRCQASKNKFAVYATEDVAHCILIAASNLAEHDMITTIMVMNVKSTWPWEELSPVNHVGQLQIPLVLFWQHTEDYKAAQDIFNSCQLKPETKIIKCPEPIANSDLNILISNYMQ